MKLNKKKGEKITTIRERFIDRNRAVVEDVCDAIIRHAQDCKEHSIEYCLSDLDLVEIYGSFRSLALMLIKVRFDVQQFLKDNKEGSL